MTEPTGEFQSEEEKQAAEQFNALDQTQTQPETQPEQPIPTEVSTQEMTPKSEIKAEFANQIPDVNAIFTRMAHTEGWGVPQEIISGSTFSGNETRRPVNEQELQTSEQALKDKLEAVESPEIKTRIQEATADLHKTAQILLADAQIRRNLLTAQLQNHPDMNRDFFYDRLQEINESVMDAANYETRARRSEYWLLQQNEWIQYGSNDSENRHVKKIHRRAEKTFRREERKKTIEGKVANLLTGIKMQFSTLKKPR
jgi:hypothetical protein